MTVVLLHPLPFDGSVWDCEIRSIDDSVAPTLYEFGDTLEAWARGVLDVVGPARLHLVGNSVGGSCALEVAALAPDRVRSIVFIGAKAGARAEPAFRDEALRVLAEEGVETAWSRFWAPLFAPDAAADIVERGRAIAARVGPDALAQGVRAFHNRNDRHEFALSLSVPFLTVAGEHDFKPHRLAEFAKELQRAEFRCVSGSGHYVPVERPSELASLVRQFLRHVGDTSAGHESPPPIDG